jgi:pimeloyl-ACP methyl ester carboxylesterase
VVYLVVIFTLVLLPFENRLAFPGSWSGPPYHDPPPELGVRQLSLDSGDGNVIHAWFLAPEGWTPKQGAVLYSHGNGMNLSGWQSTIDAYRRELKRAVLIYDYPGFGRSTGRPTEKGCYAAIDAAYDWLVEEADVPPREIILVGSSMGGAFATDKAARAPCRMLVLISAFTSFPDVAQYHYPFLPARWVVSNRMDNARKIASVEAPVLVVHGRDDRVVPFRMGERLHELAGEPKRFLALDDHPHADPMTPEYFSVLRQLLKLTATKSSGGG